MALAPKRYQPEPIVKKKKILRYKDWSQRDQMSYDLERMKKKGIISNGIGVGP
jgi:hypothetical protein